MQAVIDYLESINPILAAFYATLFTWALTAAGAGLVFFFRTMNRAVLDGMLGFTGGVMVAASFWSLLAPGIEMSPGEGFVKVLPAAIGFLLGALFIFGLDKVLPHLHINFKESEKEGIETPWRRTTLLTLAITLHNIPEGLAVGVLFGGVAAGFEGASVGAATALALGIGLQNFPEGFAVAIVQAAEGSTYGIVPYVNPPVTGSIAGVVGAWAVLTFEPILPYALSFAAGAMIFVVVEEVIPETQQDKYTDIATMGFIGGFIIMMALDVGLA